MKRSEIETAAALERQLRTVEYRQDVVRRLGAATFKISSATGQPRPQDITDSDDDDTLAVGLEAELLNLEVPAEQMPAVRQAFDQACQREIDRLRARLRDLGVDPDPDPDPQRGSQVHVIA
jgi:hypothetical protein